MRLLDKAGADLTPRGGSDIWNDGKRTAIEWAKRKGNHAIAEYLATVRFQPSAQNESGQLYKERGRAGRAATRDLVDIAGFDRDMMGLLDQFCTGKR